MKKYLLASVAIAFLAMSAGPALAQFDDDDGVEIEFEGCFEGESQVLCQIRFLQAVREARRELLEVLTPTYCGFSDAPAIQAALRYWYMNRPQSLGVRVDLSQVECPADTALVQFDDGVEIEFEGCLEGESQVLCQIRFLRAVREARRELLEVLTPMYCGFSDAPAIQAALRYWYMNRPRSLGVRVDLSQVECSAD